MVEKILFLQNLGLALLLGSLIGLERERDHHKADAHEFGGIRTLSLVSVLGYLVFMLFSDSVLFPVVTAGFLLLLVASYVMSSYLGKTTGATTEIAGFFTYFIGVLMGMGETLIATVITLVVVLLLYFKKTLHAFAHRVERKELYDTIKFIAIVFVVLPLLPNIVYGPLDVLNPYQIWLMVVLISTISFASYIAIKMLGPKRGIGVGGFLGGLISSTAVSLSFSGLSKKNPKVVNPFVFAILVASSAMFFRVLVTVSVLSGELLEIIALPMILMGVTGLFFAGYFWFQKDGTVQKRVSDKGLDFKSPFQLWPAVQFGLIFAALLFISKFASDYFGDRGVYFTAFFSGIFDVDAITVSMANLHKSGGLSAIAASTGIVIATLTNTLSKGAIVLFLGGKSVGWRVLLALILTAGVGLATLFLFIPEYYGFIAI
ncbi:MAG: MgtC/SapB family protein [Candidatus Gracilibacteria bacterium]